MIEKEQTQAEENVESNLLDEEDPENPNLGFMESLQLRWRRLFRKDLKHKSKKKPVKN
jgi:hypothetical protein